MSDSKELIVQHSHVFVENKISEGIETKPKNNLKKYSHSRQHLSMYSILNIYLKH